MTRKAKGKPMRLLRSVKTSRKERLYVFGHDETAIVAPADDTLPPQLADFSFESGVINPAAQLMLNDYAKVVASVQSCGARVPTASPYGYVAPLLGDVAWHQHEPFNDNLVFVEYKPTSGIEEKCIVGCPATAVSMLLYYWWKKGKIRGCVATQPYISKSMGGYRFRVTKEDARQTFDFGNMCDIYTKRKGAKYVDVVSYTEQQAQAVADLCAHVGKAMQSYYSPTGSGQFPAQVVEAIEQKLHLGKVTLYEQPTSADQYDEVHLDKVRESLMKGIPVLVCGYTGKQANAEGHWFICDGYNPSNDTYHINWGWGLGFNNGWFAMSLLSYLRKETSFNFSFKKTFVVWDEEPSLLFDVNGDGRINMSDVTKVINAGNSGEYVPPCDVNYDGKIDNKDSEEIINTILGKEKL
jgi:hypothetical protein